MNEQQRTALVWDRLGGRSFVAFLGCVLAYVVTAIGIFMQAKMLPKLDTGNLIAAAGILTGGASIYALRSAAGDLADRPTQPSPSVQVDSAETVQAAQPQAPTDV